MRKTARQFFALKNKDGGIQNSKLKIQNSKLEVLIYQDKESVKGHKGIGIMLVSRVRNHNLNLARNRNIIVLVLGDIFISL